MLYFSSAEIFEGEIHIGKVALIRIDFYRRLVECRRRALRFFKIHDHSFFDLQNEV